MPSTTARHLPIYFAIDSSQRNPTPCETNCGSSDLVDACAGLVSAAALQLRRRPTMCSGQRLCEEEQKDNCRGAKGQPCGDAKRPSHNSFRTLLRNCSACKGGCHGSQDNICLVFVKMFQQFAPKNAWDCVKSVPQKQFRAWQGGTLFGFARVLDLRSQNLQTWRFLHRVERRWRPSNVDRLVRGFCCRILPG